MKKSLAIEYPSVASEWDYIRNGDLIPDDVAPFSHKHVWWKCKQCGHEWQAEIASRSNGNGCPICGQRRAREKATKKNLIPGVNDFKTMHPEAATEWHQTLNGDQKPEDFSPFSGKKVWWHCNKCGGDWNALISSRAIGRGCPFCSGRKVLPGFNDFASHFPELAKEWDTAKNGELTPDKVSVHSNKKVYWKCIKCNYEWKATPGDRSYGHGCPKCSNKQRAERLTKKNLIPGENDLKTLHPDIASDWDYEKNSDRPEEYSQFSLRKKWWLCSAGHSYEQTIAARVYQKQGCPYCASRKVLSGFNDLEHLYPEIAAEWDYEKNDKNPSEVMSKSSYRAFWICPKGHCFRVMVSERTTAGKVEYCPYCSGKKVLIGFNDLSTVRPDIAAQWDYDSNGDFKPSDVTEYSLKKAWWVCDKGHRWKSTIAGRSRGNGCPYCSNTWVLKGYNDVATFCPDLVKEWSPENDKGPDEYLYGSHHKVKWVCSNCGYKWNTVIRHRTVRGNGCPNCAHYFKTSAPEQAVFYYVKQVFPDAINSFSGEESGEWEIDIYIPSLKLGIEYDGAFWHSNEKRDLTKSKVLHEKGIELIRIRDSKAAPLEDGSEQILTDTKADELVKLEPAIKELFNRISNKYMLKLMPEIDLERDRMDILSLSEGNKFEKSLAATGSPILRKWDYEKNAMLTPEKVTPHSKKKAWWVCSKCGKSWQQCIANKFKGGLYCESCNKTSSNKKRIVKALREGKSTPLTAFPVLVKEWFDDEDIGLFTTGSNKKARWKCSKCGNVFYQIIRNRTSQKQGCPICGNEAKGTPKEIMNLETREVFKSIKEAAKSYNISVSAVGASANGRINTAAGYHWAFVVDGKVDSEKDLPEQISFFD